MKSLSLEPKQVWSPIEPKNPIGTVTVVGVGKDYQDITCVVFTDENDNLYAHQIGVFLRAFTHGKTATTNPA